MLIQQEQMEAFQMLLSSTIDVFKQHELLSISCVAGATGVRAGIWIKSIIDKGVMEKAQQRHERDTERLTQVTKERDNADARISKLLNLLEEWNKRPTILLEQSENYLAEMSAEAAVEDFQKIVMPVPRKRRFSSLLRRHNSPGGLLQ